VKGGLHHVVVTADAHVDVCRHVHDMAGARHEREQAIRFRLRALRRIGGFPQVDPVVKRARVVGVGRDHLLE
jgi:hypothetical protein